MYLKSLTLKGFKSFADRTHMVFDPGLTVVVGPNGSGKSNVSDAILWVLGEQSAKQLRGQAMEDVIFSGSSARKPVGLAEVTLVLDNTDHTLPIDFTEVAITRRMYRSGESEYLINNAPARLMDITDILHDSGLGKDTHSIISQGKLDSILASRPEERRSLIEEAAGISKHRRRKERSERKLKSMQDNLTRAKDI
ncbi:MAG: AAA family ATPase, partial [Atopobiaceae bacterium]|nr:AAA family ATPase [Atopobiaceae bacterium]